MTVEAAASLYFSPERFKFEVLASDRVRISPANGALDVDLTHTSFMLAPDPTLGFQSFAGISEEISSLTGQIAQEMAGDSGGLAVYDPDPQLRVDLTVAGAALLLGTGEYDRFFPTPPFDEKSPFDLLMEYFSDTDAVQIVTPTHAQDGYVPDVVFRELAFGGNPIIAPGISDELRETIPLAHLDGMSPTGPVGPAEDLVGIVVAVQGTLEDAVDLAANTPGTEIAEIVDTLEPEEEFTLSMTFAQNSAGATDRYLSNLIEVPTVSEWGIVVLVLLLLTGVTITFRRRRGSMKVA